MELTNELCIVQIKTDTTYTVQSSNNKYYDLELNPENYKHDDLYMTLSIHINLFSNAFNIALVGDFFSYDTDCAVLDGNILTVMQNNSISQIDIENAKLQLHKRFECTGCAFSLFRVPYGFIVYGEIEIVRLNLNFDRVWGFSGRDIFVSASQKVPFELCKDFIKLYDWMDNYYELDFNGNLIRDCPVT